MQDILIRIFIFIGSGLMVINIISYLHYMLYVNRMEGLDKVRRILLLPLILLVLFLIGYLLVGILMEPDLIVSLILFGGSVFVMIIIGVIRSITKRIQYSEHLHFQLEAARQANAAKTVFLSNMSHDIRTPLNAIIGYSHLASQEDVSLSDIRSHVVKIESAGRQLLSLINDVLEISRIESGRMELAEDLADICTVTGEACDIFSGPAAEKGLHFIVETDNVENRTVLFDRTQWSRVLQNLISNALKFTPEGGTVKVSLQQLPDAPENTAAGTESLPAAANSRSACESSVPEAAERRTYELRVMDTGIGMSEEFSKIVFDAFERERTTTVSGIQGTGLGLAITKNIVDLMGGTINVKTAPGEGTEFTIQVSFPICTKGNSFCGRSQLRESASDFSGKHILLVDDVAINREVASMILQNMHFSVETAADGAEAVERIRTSAPGTFDAVLMDVQMPVMNGYEAARAIRALSDPALSSVPILAVTANTFSEDRQQALEAGMDGHIGKPLNPDEMTAELHRVLG